MRIAQTFWTAGRNPLEKNPSSFDFQNMAENRLFHPLSIFVKGFENEIRNK